FSMEFAMASALIAGRAGLAELSDAFVRRPDVQALMQRVAVEPDDRMDPLTGYAIYDEVTLETEDGTHPTVRITKVRGGPDLPLSRDELWTKFEDCLQVGAARVPARELFDALMSLDRLPQARDLPGLSAA
ncbi:MAG TPA: MmgE/PrpD family protein, partial [Burkholderiales bacterium]|nr:MmgE/PrpD family protein [Burkholderiales bacterium]